MPTPSTMPAGNPARTFPAARNKLWQLEASRGAAAIYVVLDHVWEHTALHSNNVATALLSHGLAAVVLFFFLSGFVIHYTTATARNLTFRRFFLKRFIRIYPLFLISLVLSYAMMRWSHGRVLSGDVSTLVGNVFMLQRFDGARLGGWYAPFCNNEPLWSLTYEWWFYMAFYPIQRYVPRPAQVWLVFGLSQMGLLSNFLIPNQLSMVAAFFLIWWTGVELSNAYQAGCTIAWKLVIAPTFMLMVLFGLITLRMHTRVFGPSERELMLFQSQCLKDALGLLGAGLIWYRFRYAIPDRIWRWLRHVAPISYAIYVFHYPVVIEGVLLLRRVPLVLAFAAVGAILAGLSYLCEIVFQARINRWVFGMPIKASK